MLVLGLWKRRRASLSHHSVRPLKPSQTCPSCGRQKAKTLSERVHRCECGHVEDRDHAAARVVLNWALSELAREPGQQGEVAVAASANCETATLA
jgi:putative transposase